MCAGDISDDDSRGGLDYVVFGIGMGASLVLLGMFGRTIGPSLRYRTSRTSGEVLKAEELVARVAWSRFCSSLGAAIALGGLLLLVVTGIVMALRVGDSVGAVSVGLALVAILALMVLWTWAFVGRFGLYGIVAPSPRTKKTPKETRPPKEKKQKVVQPVTDLPTPAVLPESGEATPASPSQGDRPRTEQPKRSFKPWSTPAEPTIGPTAPATGPSAMAETVGIDSSRSEIVNPSDAAALERILSEPDPQLPDQQLLETESDAEISEIADSVEQTDTDEEAPSESSASETEPEPEAEPNAQIDPASVPAAPWNRRKHQRR